MITEHLKIVLLALSPFIIIFIVSCLYFIPKIDKDKTNAIYYVIPPMFFIIGGSLLIWIPLLILSVIGIYVDVKGNIKEDIYDKIKKLY